MGQSFEKGAGETGRSSLFHSWFDFLEKLIDEKTILDLLKQLRPIAVTRKLLQETQIGKDVNVLRKYESEAHPEKATQIKKEAKALVDQWRQAVDSSASSPVVASGGDSSKLSKKEESKIATKKSESKAKVSSPTEAKKEPVKQESTKKSAQDDDDDVVMPQTGNHLRDKSIEMLYQALSTDASAGFLLFRFFPFLSMCVLRQCRLGFDLVQSRGDRENCL